MFFILSKTLQFLIHPINWVLGLALYGLFSKNEKRKKRGVVSSLLLLIFLTNPFIHDVVFNFWETPAVPMAELADHDIAIVLGGYSDPKAEPRDRIHLRTSPNRLTNAIQLYKSGKARTIVLTGGSATIIGEKLGESANIARYISDLGVPDEVVLAEGKSRNTHENALQTKTLLAENGLQDARCVLVTSAFHMPRATRCFEKVGMKVTPFSTDSCVPQKKKENLLNYLAPSSDALADWEKIVKEWVGMLAYKAKGYI